MLQLLTSFIPVRKLWFVGLALFLAVGLPLQREKVKSAELQTRAMAIPNYAFIISDWRFFDENRNGGAGDFVTGPGTPPVGQGSAMLQVNNKTQGYALGTQILHPLPLRLDRIKVLRYSTYRASSDLGNNLAITFQFPVDFDLTDSDTSYQGRLVFEPYLSGTTVPQNTWQTWDMLTVRAWWDTGGKLPCTPCTWNEILSAFPNIGVHPTFSGVLFKAGSGWDTFQGYIDRFEIAIDDPANTFSFDFDPPPTVEEVRLGGTTPISSGQVLTQTNNFLRIVFQHDSPFYQPLALWNYPNHPDDITNPANYQLVHTTLGSIPINQVTYFEDTSTNTYYVTLQVNNGQPLPNGWYSLTVLGTTSVVDINGIPLAGNGTTSGTNFNLEFAIQVPPRKLPETGYPPIVGYRGQKIQAGPSYKTELSLEIPKLNVEAPIIGIPQTGDTWDVSWLYDQVGWLEGSAFPTWPGNTVLTAHVWNYDGTPGLFYRLQEMKYGDQIFIKAWGKTYVYEVRERLWAFPGEVDSVFESKERDWITLVTCWGFNPLTETYIFRFGIRAVLMEIRETP